MDFEPAIAAVPGVNPQQYDVGLFGSGAVQCSSDNTQCYIVVNLAQWTGSRAELAEKGRIKLPLMVKLQYNYELGGVQQPGVQELCINMNLQLDKGLLDLWKPNRMLNSSIVFFNNTQNAIMSLKRPVDGLRNIAAGTCLVAATADFVTRIGMRVSCTQGDEEAKLAFADYKETCTAAEGCQECLDALWAVRTTELARNWACDRLFCPSVPTLAHHIETFNDPLLPNEDSKCKLNDAALCEREYKRFYDSAGLFVNEWAKANNVRTGSVMDDISELIAQTNMFCPGLQDGFARQVVRVQGTEYYIDDDKRIFEVVPRRLADRQGTTVAVYEEEYTIIRELVPGIDTVPEQILAIIADEAELPKTSIFDPTAGPFDSLIGGCLPALSGYLGQWHDIAGAVKQCLQMVQQNGEGTPGVCKAILSRYVCDAIWDSVRCLGGGLSSGNQNLNLDSSSGLLSFGRMISDAGASVSDSVSGRYGETAMFNAMFNERKLVHGACLAFFTGDVFGGVSLDTMFDANVGMPVLNSEALVAPATMRFMGSNPFSQGWATFIYHVGYAIQAGADLSYTVRLECSNEAGCPEFGNEANPVACDCYYRGTPESSIIDSGQLSAGELLSQERYLSLTEGLRYDKVVLEYTWTDNSGNTRTDRVAKKLKLAGGSPSAHCGFDMASREYRCETIIGADGAAFFIGSPAVALPSGASYFRLGDQLKLAGEFRIEMPDSGPAPKFIVVDIKNHHGRSLANYPAYSLIHGTGTYRLDGFALWPALNANHFLSSPRGGSDCQERTPASPARFSVEVRISEAVESDQGLEPASAPVNYEGNPQLFRFTVDVVCNDGGSVPDALRLSSAALRLYQEHPNEPYLLSSSQDLADLDNAVVLVPYSDQKVVFSTISASGEGQLQLSISADGELFELASGESIQSAAWEPNMQDDIEVRQVQLVLSDAHSTVQYPGVPVTLTLKRTSKSPRS
jgi:hypothetical protein